MLFNFINQYIYKLIIEIGYTYLYINQINLKNEVVSKF